MTQARPLREKARHGDFLFPVNVYETKLPEGTQIPLFYHWHPEIEIFFVLRGKTGFQVEGEQLFLEAGDVLLIRPNSLHGPHDRLEGSLESRAAVFDYSFLAGIGNDRIEQEYLRPFLLEGKSRYLLLKNGGEEGQTKEREELSALSVLLNRLFDVFQKKEKGYELLTRAWLLEAVYGMLRLCPGETEGALLTEGKSREEKSRMIRSIVQYVEERYTGRLRLGELADYLSLSEGYLCRFFRKNFHMTFVEYVQRVRLQRAGRLLLETDDAVGKIAMDVGFGSLSHFTTAFGKYYHTTPQKFRKGQDPEKISQFQEGNGRKK